MTAAQAGVVIVGSGLGGYTLARELRKLDRHTPLTLVTADGGEMYSKPMLSNAFGQNKSLDALVMKSAEQAAAELGITLLARSRVTAIDRAARSLRIGDNDVAYDRLVLALGADPRAYTVPGAEQVPIATVNDLDSYRAWREGLLPQGRVLLIGAGLIGCEFANDMASAGYRVTVIDPAAWPLGRLLPPALGELLRHGLEQVGVVVHTGRSVARIDTVAGDGFSAELDDGTRVGFDHALSAIGLVPRVALAAAAGLTVDRGIVVDRTLRSSDEAIYALGDCAQTEAGPLPFVLPLMAQARALAATLNGTPTPVTLPAMPVVVKTPCLPLAVCPPPPGSRGDWIVTGEGRDQQALFQDETGRSLGFALSGGAVGQRQSLAKEMPGVLG
jgi:rubredoxin-NAD+ reductase